MAAVILVSFLILPLVEITFFILVSDILGLGLTIGLVLLTTLVGAWLFRYLGFTAFRRLQESLARQEYPEVRLFSAVCLFASAMLLIVPGFFTDGLGILLFLPSLRGLLRHAIFDHLASSGVVFVHEKGSFSHEEKGAPGENGPAWRPGRRESHVIEGKFEDLTAGKKGSVPGSTSLPEGHGRDDGGKESEGVADADGTPASS
jgi:UPF0716 protein FxsA